MATVIYNKLIKLSKNLEDPQHPLLGPNIKVLYLTGLLRTGTKFEIICYYSLIICFFILIILQFVNAYFRVRINVIDALEDVSILFLNIVAFSKLIMFSFRQNIWKQLITNISAEEIHQLSKNECSIEKIMRSYRIYSRVITYSYWYLIIIAQLIFVSAPAVKYMNSNYHGDIINGVKPLPLIVGSWFPFDETKSPGYWIAFVYQFILIIYGCNAVAVFDSSAVAIMTFLKGQLLILKEQCRQLFRSDTFSRQEILDRIKECHRHHNFILRQYNLFNSLLSGVMFLYTVVCSIYLCGYSIQLSVGQLTTSQKIWVLQFTSTLISQLFLYCWHSNEVAEASYSLNQGIYDSQWWKADVEIRKHILLLAGKLSQTITLDAGPFTQLSVATFLAVNSLLIQIR